MNLRFIIGVVCAMMFIDVASSQRSGLLDYLRRLLGQQRGRGPVIQIIRAPARRISTSAASSASSSAVAGLADIGLGGVFGGHGGMFGGTVGVHQPQTFTIQRQASSAQTLFAHDPNEDVLRRQATVPAQTLFAHDPSEDALRRHAALGLGVPVHTVDVNTIDSSSLQQFGHRGQQSFVDRPDPADPIDVLYAPRHMVTRPGDAERLQKMTDSDAIILV